MPTRRLTSLLGSTLHALKTAMSFRMGGRSPRPVRSPLGSFEGLEPRWLLSAVHADGVPVPAAVSDLITPSVLNGTPTSGFASVGLIGDLQGDDSSGTLIAPQWVLTAAHNSEDLGDTEGRFTIGGKTYSSQLIIVHPNYRPNRIGANNANDLALWMLSEPVEGITPSPIYRQRPKVGTLLTLVGFGAGGDLDGQNGDFGIKRVGTTPLEKVTTKQLRWVFDQPTDSNTGPGDSGGPAFIKVGKKYYLAGVTSGGEFDDASRGDTAYDTRVDAYQKWIDKVIKDPFKAARNR